ncbi:MAG: glutamine amidotransferase [Spirochaetota bacterium]
MIKVLYVGDAAGVLGPRFIASPFNLENKGFSIHIWCQPVLDALRADGEIEVTHMTNWDAYRDFPKTPEEFRKYNVVFLSDVESEVLLLYPEWTKAPMGPNRLRSLRDYVANGGALCMIGGWSSFSGRFGTAAYQNTPVEEALPVNCIPAGDDRVETPEGTWVEVLDTGHPVTGGIPWDKCPCFLGYNRIIAKEGATVLARTKEKGDPFIVVWEFKKGRSMAFASDVSPHWAVAFQKWEYYGQFFRQMVRWLARADYA